MKSMMNALGDLLKDSTTMFFKCIDVSNCNITISDDKNNVYDFYNYYYNYTKNETVDFNLTLLTAFIGGLLLRSKGFRVTTGLLFIPIIGATIWIWNFDFRFKDHGIFDYDILKIINLIIIYILLLCGIGGSALLSQQILIEGHLKYKTYSSEKKEEKNQKTIIHYKNKGTSMNKKEKEYLEKKLEEKRKRNDNNKFDYFFMICLTTIIGYLGKYLTVLLLDYILAHAYRIDYNNKLFFIFTITLYAISILLSLLLYSLYKNCIFKYGKKEEDEKKVINISKICGYIIYSGTIKKNKEENKSCCKLCCESFYNCCDYTFCNIINEACEYINSGHHPYSCCKCCKYDVKDYNKKEDEFWYCYKTERKSSWCNNFFANETQKKIFPYMLEYFILQLTTIGFEKQYEKYKNENVHIKTRISVYVLSFILFFYFTLSFNKIFFNKDKKTENNKQDKISMLSNEILHGTHGILIFNSVFSVVFSVIYLFYTENDIKALFFEDNINFIFIPILMNHFYYFTLNYYCTFTGEKDKKFEIISISTLV